MNVTNLDSVSDSTMLYILEEYGHGSCHDLTGWLISVYDGFRAFGLFDKHGVIYHSFLGLEENKGFDIYGINTLKEIKERYDLGNVLKIKELSEQDLSLYCDDFFDFKDTIEEDFKYALNYFKIEMTELKEGKLND